MRILCIGNSFSVDATRYLNQIARCDKTELEVHNLYIGGCPLDFHYLNMLTENKNYEYWFNGKCTGLKISLKEALANQGFHGWDYITIQQASAKSPYFETYEPYITEVIKYVRKFAPKAKIAVHQTWGYETGSEMLKNLGYADYNAMFKDVEASYNKAAEAINADIIIKSGKLLKTMLENGFEKVHRDTFHANLGYGRFAIGLLWYKTLTGNDITNTTFRDFDIEVSKEEVEKAIECVNKMF